MKRSGSDQLLVSCHLFGEKGNVGEPGVDVSVARVGFKEGLTAHHRVSRNIDSWWFAIRKLHSDRGETLHAGK